MWHFGEKKFRAACGGWRPSRRGRRPRPGGEGGDTRYRYNVNDWPVEIITPDDQHYSIAYDSAGRIARLSFPNGNVQRFLYNVRGLVASTTTTW